MRRTALLNPVALRGRTGRRHPHLERELTRRGIAVQIPNGVAAMRDAAAAAFERGDAVVVCGGDGTVAPIAGIAAECDGTIAVVPTGAGNDFARHLGIDPRRTLAAVGLLDDGRVARCDLGQARAADSTEAWFTTVANVKFDAEANRWANRVRWATGTPLSVLAVLRTLVTYRPVPVRVVVDGVPFESPVRLVAVGNGRYYGGGMMITSGPRSTTAVSTCA